jgi:hypothetical protein
MGFCKLVLTKTDLHCDLREEQRAHCKICGLFGNCASEIETDLDLVMFHIVQLQNFATSEINISTNKAIVNEDARYIVD